MEMQYKILVFASQKQIQALIVDEKGRTEPISINGNIKISYNSDEDLEIFITAVKETYNTESFSDLDIVVLIVNCGANAKKKKKLYLHFEGASDISIINAVYILPFVSGKKEKFSGNSVRFIQILDAVYTISVDEALNITCKKSDDTIAVDENVQTLLTEDFSFLFSLNAESFDLSKKVIEESETEQAENIPEEKKEQIANLAGIINALPKTENLPAVAERQLPAVENKIGQMIFVEGGEIAESALQNLYPIGCIFYSYKFSEHIPDFYISSTPVTVQQYYDVMGNLPEYLFKLLMKDFCIDHGFESGAYIYKTKSFISESELLVAKDAHNFFIMPKSVLDCVDKSLLEKGFFYEAEKVYEDLIKSYGKDTPVTLIQRTEIEEFCNKLSELEKLEPFYQEKSFNKNGYRLPTVREWVYASLGGINHNDFQYSGSNTLSEVGWYKENSSNIIHPVAQKNPNTLGLYDMSGLIREYICIFTETVRNNYVIGGSYEDSYEYSAFSIIRSTIQSSDDRPNKYIGFRICRPAK